METKNEGEKQKNYRLQLQSNEIWNMAIIG